MQYTHWVSRIDERINEWTVRIQMCMSEWPLCVRTLIVMSNNNNNNIKIMAS